MTNENREHSRIEKDFTFHFCVVGASPEKWDMAFIKNIGAGGIKFKALNDLKLADKMIQLRIRIPELAPQLLEIKAIILETQNSFIRAKFIDLTEINKKHLIIVEKMVQMQGVKKKMF